MPASAARVQPEGFCENNAVNEAKRKRTKRCSDAMMGAKNTNVGLNAQIAAAVSAAGRLLDNASVSL